MPEPNPRLDSVGTQAGAGTPNDSEDRSPESSRLQRAARRLIRVLWCLVALLGVLLFLRTCVVAPYRIPTSSMEPTLMGDHAGDGVRGDTVLVLKVAYALSAPQRWDLVAFDAVRPERSGVVPELVKRVVGLPGETIEIAGGDVIVDGRAVDRPATAPPVRYVRRGPYGLRPVTLGEDEYFVLGDNSAVSEDSRYFGPLPRANVFGRVVAIVAPWARAGAVH